MEATTESSTQGPLKKYFDEPKLKQDKEIVDILELYVPPMGMWFQKSTKFFDLEAEVDTFLNSEKKVLLLLGEAGAGKSTFNRLLSWRLWGNYVSKDKYIPLFISLQTIKDSKERIIENYLKDINFPGENIKNLKTEHRFVFILDGYDESNLFDDIKDHELNIYDRNRLHDWKAKVIISCRSEYLSTEYQKKFIPHNAPKFFQEIWLAPFSEVKIQEYIRKYAKKQKKTTQGMSCDEQKYNAVLERIPNSDQLLSNPLILNFVVQIMPDLDQHPKKSITRLTLYNKLVEKFQDHLSRFQLDEKEKKAFTELDSDFIRHCMRLAGDMYKANKKEYSDADNKNRLNKLFGSKDLKTRFSFFQSPSLNYQFIHESFFEYFVARLIIKEILDKDKLDLFKKFLLLRDPGVVRFLTEYAQNDEDSKGANKFKDNLYDFIVESKKDNDFEVAAANAITILNRAGRSFSGEDLNGIKISGADLSCGLFHHTEFKGADLSNVNFKGAWLQDANFSDANMSGVQFGEFPFLNHQDECHCCCYSPDGHFLAIASGVKIYLYNIETLDVKCIFEGHTDTVRSMSFSPDGTQLASGSDDETVRLWSPENSDQDPHILEGHTDAVCSVAFSHDGSLLASGSYDETVRLWSLENSDQNPRILEKHTGPVYSVAFSPCSKQLASGSDDNTVIIWSLENLDLGTQHASGSDNKTVDLKPLILKGHTDSVLSVTFSRDGNQLASGSSDNTVRLWFLDNLKLTPCILNGHTHYVSSVSFSPDGTQLASGSYDETVRLWSLKNLDLDPRILEGHTGKVWSVTFSPDGSQLASGSYDETVRLWSLENLDLNSHITKDHTGKIWSVAFSPDVTQVASASYDKTVRLWSLKNLDLDPRILEGHTSYVYSVTFLSNSEQLASSSSDKTVRLWSLENKRTIEHTDLVNSVSFSPVVTQLASGSDDGKVRLWSIENFDLDSKIPIEPQILEGHTSCVYSVAFSPDGKLLASGSDDKKVRLWFLDNLKSNPFILYRHTDKVRSVIFSPNDEQLASGSDDKTVILWSLKNLKLNPCIHILKGHSHRVSSVSFSPDSIQLASSSDDKTVRLWSTVSGNCLIIIHLPGAVRSLDWKKAKEEEFLLTGGSDKIIRLWRVKSKDDQTSQVALHWTSRQNMLWISKANIQNVKGLSSMNSRLLMQRGAAE